MTETFLAISDSLLDHPMIEKLKAEHYKILIKFLRLLNFCEQTCDAHGKKIKVKRGEILTTYRKLEIKLNTTKRVLIRLFDKLEEAGIFSRTCAGNEKKRYLQKTIFSLDEKYMVKKKTVPIVAKTVPTKFDDLPREKPQSAEKTVPQFNMQPSSLPLNVCLEGAIARAHTPLKSSQVEDYPKEMPQLPLVQTDKEKGRRKETPIQIEQIDTFILWAETYSHKFIRDSVSYWVRTFGIDRLSEEFQNMVSEKRKVQIKDIHRWITSALKRGYVPESKRIEQNRMWLMSLITEKRISFIKVNQKYCEFRHLTYNDSLYFDRVDFKTNIMKIIEMLQDRKQREVCYG